MSDYNLPPEQWRPLFERVGVEFGYRPLANKIGMNHTRLRRLMLGGGTSIQAVKAVADALNVSPEKVRELRGEPGEVVEPFILPDDAGRLTHDERKVVRAVVRALLDARDRHADSTSTPPAPPAEEPRAPRPEDEKTRAGDKPADLNPADQGGRLVSFPTRDDVLPEGIAANLGDKGVPDDESAPGEAIEPIPDDDDLP